MFIVLYLIFLAAIIAACIYCSNKLTTWATKPKEDGAVDKDRVHMLSVLAVFGSAWLVFRTVSHLADAVHWLALRVG